MIGSDKGAQVMLPEVASRSPQAGGAVEREPSVERREVTY
jgi:hypothetical protein